MLVFGSRALRAREPAARPARVAVFVRNGRLPSAQNGAEVLSCGRLERYNVIIEGDATTGDNTGGAMSVVACASAVDLALVAAASRT
ncbi:MAG: hypothetical protein K6U89_14665 [Chloroflexi bacterium]|nr:hypothetical protein [Chloroflexota bacterium]